MNYLLKIMSYATSVVAAVVFVSGSSLAQSVGNAQLQSGGLIEKFSAADVSSMLEGLEIASSLQPYQDDGSATLAATTKGGGVFIISMFQCDDASVGYGCKQALLYTGMSNAGLAYEDLNVFHASADVTRAVNVAEQQMVIFGTPIYSHGGIGREHFQILAALFLHDMQEYVNAKNEGATSVAMKVLRSRGKTGNVVLDADVTTAARGLIGGTYEHALGAALSNTWSVEFLTDEAAKLVKAD